MSHSALAEHTAISRGTVRNLLADALAQGWFAPGSAAGALRFAPQSLRVTRHWIARELVWMHGLACAAFAWLNVSAPPPARARPRAEPCS